MKYVLQDEINVPTKFGDPILACVWGPLVMPGPVTVVLYKSSDLCANFHEFLCIANPSKNVIL